MLIGRCYRLFLLITILLLVTALPACGQTSYSVEDHLERATSFQAEGNHSAAIIELKNAVQQDPASAEARWRLGVAHLVVNDGATAETELLRARDLGMDPDAVRIPLMRAWLMLNRHQQVIEETRHINSFPADHAVTAMALRGQALLINDEAGPAREILQAAIDEDESNLDARFGMAMAEILTGNDGQAHAWIDRTLEIDPAYARAHELRGDLYRQAGRLDESIAAFGAAIDAGYQPFSPRLKRAMTHVANEDYSAAKRDLAALDRRYRNQPAVHFTHGLVYFREQNYPEAQRRFEQALAANNQYAPAMFYLGAAHYAQEHWSQADRHLNRFLERNPDSSDAVALLARNHVQQSRMDDAIELLEVSLQRFDSPNSGLSEMLSVLYLERGDEERGIEALQTALMKNPDSPGLQEMLGVALMRSGEPGAGAEVLDRASGTQPGSSMSPAAARILMHVQRQEYGRGLELARQYRDEDPDNAEPWNLMGAALVGLERHDEARDAFGKALELDPDRTSTAMNLGGLEMRLGNHDRAREVFESIQKRDPGHPFSAQQLAVIELQQNDTDAAIEWLRSAVSSHPGILEPALTLARLELNSGQAEAALETLETALQRHPQRLSVHFAKGDALRALGRTDDAVAAMEHAAEVAPGSAEVHYRLAVAREAAGDALGQMRSLRRALEIDPRHFRSRTMITFELALRGEHDEARDNLASLKQQHPERPDVRALEGWFALRDGEPEVAIEAYTDAMTQTARRSWVLELALAQREIGDIEGASATYERWLAAMPGDIEMRHVLATNQMRARADADAIRSYKEILEQNHMDIIALNNLAWLLRERDTTDALGYAERALELAPNSAGVLDTVGVVLFYSRKLEESAELLKKAVERDSDNPQINYHLGRTLHAQGDIAGARAVLRRALDLGNSFAGKERAQALLDEIGN